MGFWTANGYIGGLSYIAFLLALPRMTLLVSLVFSLGAVAWVAQPLHLTGLWACGGALLGWSMWLLAPRFLIAVLASALYWHTNFFLCFCAHIAALAMLLLNAYIVEADTEWKRKRADAFFRTRKWECIEVLCLSFIFFIDVVKRSSRALRGEHLRAHKNGGKFRPW